MIGVRRRAEGFEGMCDYCRQWWPLPEDETEAREFWLLEKKSLRQCRACYREYYRLAQAKRREDPEKRAKDREGVAAMKDALRHYGLLGEYRRRHYMRHRERICADRRAKYAAQRAAAGKPYTPREMAA